MSFRLDVRKRARAALAPALFLSVAAYFGWNVTQGNHGLRANAERQDMLRQVRQDNLSARTERDGWARRVAGLRANHLDPDTLDERARAMIGLADPADVVVQYATKDNLFGQE